MEPRQDQIGWSSLAFSRSICQYAAAMRNSTALVALTASVLLGFAANTQAQSYSISWYKIAGGGGTSTNGAYTLSSTIGQHDAGTMSGGPYTLTGGFWGMIATVQVPGAPFLSLHTTNSTSVVLSWSTVYPGFSLLQNPTPQGTNWARVNTNTYPITVSNGTNYVTVPMTGANQYFKLSNP